MFAKLSYLHSGEVVTPPAIAQRSEYSNSLSMLST